MDYITHLIKSKRIAKGTAIPSIKDISQKYIKKENIHSAPHVDTL